MNFLYADVVDSIRLRTSSLGLQDVERHYLDS
jgi:hypothetical protein